MDCKKDFVPPLDAGAGFKPLLHKVLFFGEKNTECGHQNQESRKEKPALPVIQPARQCENRDPYRNNTDKGA